MAEPVTLQTLLTYLTLISVPVGVFYHIMTLRNTRKNQETQLETRQAQLFMNLYETYRSLEFRKQWTMILQQEWTDIDDFMEKYGSDNNPEAWSNWMSVASFFHGIGILVKKGLVQPSLLDELISPNVFMAWVMMGPIVKGFEEYVKRPSIRNRYRDAEGHSLSKIFKSWSGFEYLYDELKRREQQRLELKT